MKKLILISISIISIIILLFCIFLLFFTIVEYRPKNKTSLRNLNSSNIPVKKNYIINKEQIKIVSWNLGYCALDKNTDFILDGGKMSKGRNKVAIQQNLNSITKNLLQFNADFYFIQEIGINSDRSYHINELETLTDNFNAYNGWIAINYKCLFVPFPLHNPMGGVLSGLATFSKWNAISSIRNQLPGNYSWPIKLFHLKRCVIINKFKSNKADKFWYFINIHLSAYDSDGKLRKNQLSFLKQKIIELYDNKNFVVIGGDWNSLFPKITKKIYGPYTTSEKDLYWVKRLPDNWKPKNWNWAYDTSTPSCRADDKPYVKEENFTTTIDGFLVSPNLDVKSVDAINLNFVNTDHNPVILNIKIKE